MTLSIPQDILPVDGRFGCGPSKIREDHIHAMAQSAVLGTSHRQAPVKNLVARVRSGLSELLRAPDGYEIILGNGGATAFWDAAAFGLIEHRSQNLAFGEFGQKFATAAAAPWLEAPEVRKAEPGTRSEPVPSPGVDLYAWPQNETSTGVMAEVTRVAGDPNSLTVIDATSAAGGVNVQLSACDVYYFSPQKNLGADGGLWLAAVSPTAIERIERVASSGRYIPEFLSLKNALDNSRREQTLNTPAISTLLLLESQLNWILGNGGLAWADARTRESSGILYDWATRTSYTTPFVANPAHRSQVVVTIDFDAEIDAGTISAALRNNGIVDTEPYRKLGRNQLRVATFTAIEPSDIVALTRAIEYVVAHTSQLGQRS